MSKTELKFVELPDRPRRRWADTWGKLAERPGEWAEWWTANPKSAWSAAKSAARNGTAFEACMVDGKSYVRAVPK